MDFLGPAGYRYEGFCFVNGQQLYFVIESPSFPSPGMAILSGAYSRHPRSLTGVVILQSSAMPDGAITAAPVIIEYREPLSGDAAADERRWQEKLANDPIVLAKGQDSHPELPERYARILRPVVGVATANGSFDHILVVPTLE